MRYNQRHANHLFSPQHPAIQAGVFRFDANEIDL